MYTNNLGTQIDKLAKAGTQLNNPTLTNRLTELQTLTTTVKSLLANTLPELMLQMLWVINHTRTTLTLAVSTTTARNHLHFIRQGIIHTLNQSPQFNNLTDITIKVTHIPY